MRRKLVDVFEKESVTIAKMCIFCNGSIGQMHNSVIYALYIETHTI
jgi:hypothetical protein